MTTFFSCFLYAQSGLNITQGDRVDRDGYVTIGDEDGSHLALSTNDIQPKFDSDYSSLFINFFGGDVQIGNSDGIFYNSVLNSVGIGISEPDSKLHVYGSTDASLSSNGLLMVGEGEHTNNIILDNNEIMARNNGSGSSLFINRDGGDVVFFGNSTGSFIIHDLPMGDKSNLQYESSSGKFFYDNSSRRYKENIAPLKDDWTKILRAQPVTYTRPGNPSQWEYGYLAEEIDSIGLTSMVGYDSTGKPEDVRYDKMVIYLVEILKKTSKDKLKLFGLK